MTRLLASVALALSLVVVGCGDDDDPTAPTTGTVLTSGTAVTNIGGGANSEKLYRITVPAGATQLLVTTRGGQGDVDMAVNRGARPTPSTDNACEEFGFDNDETCTIASPASGEWYILLIGAEAYSGVTLTATVTSP